MSKGNSFLGGLKKSTRITVISCSLFVIFTVIIMVFFVLFPITPSEKVIAGFGRESVANNNQSVTTTAVTTTNEFIVTQSFATTTTGRTTSHKDYTITVTKGSGFYVNNVIPTGVSPYEVWTYTPTTTTIASGIETASEPSTGETGEIPSSATGEEPIYVPEPTEAYIPPVEEPVIYDEGGDAGSGETADYAY